MAEANLRYDGDRVIIEPLDGNRVFFFSSQSPPIGVGGMGEVYVGRDNRGNRVAIKRVRPDLLRLPQVVERARAEGNFQYAHPALIEIFGTYEIYSHHGLQEVFIISRYVEGQPLTLYIERVVNNKSDRVARVCRLLYPVMDALSFLHGHQLVHLDIKPSNIMIEAERRVILMDLGITTSAGDAYNTGRTSGLVGTPNYAAPEQSYDGTNATLNVDSRADIFALGVTLAELLTGNVPTRKADGTLASLKGVPRPLAKVIYKATQPDREERYATVKEMQDAVRRAAGKKSMPLIWIAAAVVALVAVIAVFLSYFLY